MTADGFRFDPQRMIFSGGNYIANGNFESGLGGWTVAAGSASVVAINDGVVGSSAAENAANEIAHLFSDTWVTIDRGAAYWIEGSVRKSVPASAGMSTPSSKYT